VPTEKRVTSWFAERGCVAVIRRGARVHGLGKEDNNSGVSRSQPRVLESHLWPNVVVSTLVPVRAVPRQVVRAHRRFGRVYLMAEPTRRPVATRAVQEVLAYLS